MNKTGKWIYEKFGHLSNLSNISEKYSGKPLNSGELYSLAVVMAVMKKLVNNKDLDLNYNKR